MSLRARVFSGVVRRLVKAQSGGDFDVVALRALFDRPGFSPPRGTVIEAGAVAGIAGEWVRRPTAARVGRLLYVHGGGFIACSARTHRPITGAFARHGFDVFAPNYRLAPEHPFPAALDDLVAVWRVLASRGPFAIAGDSAGGNLAMALMLRARADGLPLPVAAALFSPATDLQGTGPSLIDNAERDAMLNAAGLRKLVPLYVGDADPAQPLLSPLNADLAGLPPMLIHVGESELLRDDATRLAAKARAAGVAVELAIYPVVPHAWQIARFLPEARHSVDAAAAFLATRFV